MTRTAETDDLLSLLGQRCRALRTERGLSQEDLAEASDLHRTYISLFERGQRNASYATLVRLARGLGVSVATLVGTADAEPPG